MLLPNHSFVVYFPLPVSCFCSFVSPVSPVLYVPQCCLLLFEFFVLDLGILCLDMFWEAQKIKNWLKIPVLRQTRDKIILEISIKIQLFHKCWHTVSNSGHWLGSLLNFCSTTILSTSWYDSQVINISDEMYVHSLKPAKGFAWPCIYITK